MRLCSCLGAAFVLVAASQANGQQLDMASVAARLDSAGHVTLARSGVTLVRRDYVSGRDSIEAIAARPVTSGRYPAVLLIPGFGRTARDYIPLSIQLAREGFATLAISQPGFGPSTGPPDFVGPRTMAAVRVGAALLRGEAHVDPDRWGVLGYSRGAMAASLLAVTDTTLKAAVFGAGIYDFRRAYDEIPIPGIRANMKAEAGLGDSAVAIRSSLPQMDALRCPVLILHGAKDTRVPVSQAHALRDRLQALGKVFEARILPDKEHDVGRDVLVPAAIEFFTRWLKR